MTQKYIEIDSNNKVTYIHYMPFDSAEGLHKTEAELLQTGKLVGDIPVVENIEGKQYKFVYVPETNTVTIQYEDIPLSPDQQKIADLESQNAQMLLALVNGGLM